MILLLTHFFGEQTNTTNFFTFFIHKMNADRDEVLLGIWEKCTQKFMTVVRSNQCL